MLVIQTSAQYYKHWNIKSSPVFEITVQVFQD